MIILKYIHAAVLGIALPGTPRIAGAQVAVRDVRREPALGFPDAFPLPGALVAVR